MYNWKLEKFREFDGNTNEILSSGCKLHPFSCTITSTGSASDGSWLVTGYSEAQ